MTWGQEKTAALAAIDADTMCSELRDAWDSIKQALQSRDAELIGQIMIALQDGHANRVADLICGQRSIRMDSERIAKGVSLRVAANRAAEARYSAATVNPSDCRDITVHGLRLGARWHEDEVWSFWIGGQCVDECLRDSTLSAAEAVACRVLGVPA